MRSVNFSLSDTIMSQRCCMSMSIFQMTFYSFMLTMFVVTSAWSQTAEADSAKPSRKYLLVPFGAYSEETGFQGGFVGMYFFPSTTPGKLGPKLVLSGVLTSRGQSTVIIGPTGSLDSGRLDFKAFFRYVNWPGHYWMGGNSPSDNNSSYDMNSMGVDGALLFSGAYHSTRFSSIKGGLTYYIESNRTTFDNDDDTTTSNLLMGGRRIGFGPEVQWDTRDHEGWPTQGDWFTVKSVFYNKAWASDWDFRKTTIDLRHYHTLYRSLVLALDVLWERADGSIPFDQLCAPDGSEHLRGLEKGRLRDKQQLVLQSELRFPIAGKFFGTVFSEAGKVGATTSELRDNSFRPAFGGGIRYQVHAERKMNFRLDASWVDDQLGIAASFGEAF